MEFEIFFQNLHAYKNFFHGTFNMSRPVNFMMESYLNNNATRAHIDNMYVFTAKQLYTSHSF